MQYSSTPKIGGDRVFDEDYNSSTCSFKINTMVQNYRVLLEGLPPLKTLIITNSLLKNSYNYFYTNATLTDFIVSKRSFL